MEQFSNLGLGNNFTIEYGTHHRVEARQPPFDLTYLIDNANELGRGIKETAELESIIARGMYLRIGSQIGTNKENTVDNIKTQLSTAGRVRDRSASYCSFGVGTLALPVRQFEAMEVDAARRLMSDGLLSGEFPEEELEAEVLRFIRDNKLREDDSDDLVDALAAQEKGGRMRFPMQLGQITRHDNTAQSLIKQLHATHRSRTEQQAAQLMEENYKRLLSAALRAVDDWWEAAINRPNGSTHAARFARKLVPKLERYQHMMEGDAVLPFLPHGGADARVCRVHAYDEEGAGQKVRRQRLDGAGEVRREPVRCCRIEVERFTTCLASNQSLQRNRRESQSVRGFNFE